MKIKEKQQKKTETMCAKFVYVKNRIGIVNIRQKKHLIINFESISD